MTNYDNNGYNAIITITEEYNNLIHLSGIFNSGSGNTDLVARYADCDFKSRLLVSKYADSYFPNSTGSACYVFEFYIPYDKPGCINLFVRDSDGALVPARVDYSFPSRINNMPHSYIIGDHLLITRLEEGFTLYVEPLDYDKLSKAVKLYLDRNFSEEKYNEDKAIIQQYLQQYQTMLNKRIWLISDRPDRADDNAEHFFIYSNNINDGIDKYFVVDESSPDAKRLAQVGKVICNGSAQHKLMALFAQRFISSHLHGRLRDICDGSTYPIYAGLDSCKTIFLQHGIILHDLSFWLLKPYQNLKLLITTAKEEYNAVLGQDYGYDKNVVKLTGMPRYDSLYDNNKRKILFVPTWRGHSSADDLSSSTYCKRINSLLCDKRLVAEADRYGYEIMYKPHPKYANFANCFKAAEGVKIIDYHQPYQTLFAESSLLITDYSSTVFDFSYLKKPVIYYWFTENPQTESYFDYKTMGFGEIVHNHHELIDTIVRYMADNCVMDEKYKQRVSTFFAYTDKDNNKRVYNEIINI